MVFSIACVRTRWLPALFFATATCTACFTQAQTNALDLSTAIERTLQNHPDLQAFAFKHNRIDGLRYKADLRPPVEVGVEIENFAGSDAFESFDAAETTVALSSVIELGSQRGNRVAAINAREQQLAQEQQVTALALIAETTRRYIDVLAAQAEQQIAAEAQALAQSALDAVERRVRQGASPRAELLRAQAAKARARLAIAEADSQLLIAQNNLLVMWAADITEPNIGSAQASGDLLQLTPPQSRQDFTERLPTNPQLQLMAQTIRVRQAELQASHSNGNTDLGWQLGIKHFNGDNQTALVAGINLPLFSGRRNRGDTQVARADIGEAQLQRENNLRILRNRLSNLVNQYQTHFNKVTVLRDDVIPALEQALAETESAYQRGLYSYLELVAAGRDLIDAQHNLFDTAADALRIQTNIEQLTAEPLSLPESLPTNPATAPEVSQ